MSLSNELPTVDTPNKTELAPERLRMSEIGTLGLMVNSGRVWDGCRAELRYPRSMQTFSEMAKDATIGAALSCITKNMGRVSWGVGIPRNADENLKRKKLYLEQVQKDIEGGWSSFIQEASSFIQFGFSVHEIVPRLRRKSLGSRYDDGLIGIKKLPIRAQESIYRWDYDNATRNLKCVWQYAYQLTANGEYQTATSTQVEIPASRILLFRTGVRKDSPIGESPLANVWQAWKYKQALQENEGLGIAQDMRGFKVLYIDPRYMSKDASEDEKAVFQMYQDALNGMHIGERSGMILPQMYDPDSKMKYFELDLLSVTGQKGYDVNQVITRYSNEILMALHADILKMGQDKVGSYSLAGAKTNIMAMVIEYHLKAVQSVLNTVLLPFLWKANGWDIAELDYIGYEFGDIDEPDLDDFSKAIQRVKAVGMMTPTRNNINSIAEKLGLPDRVDESTTQEELNTLLGQATSRSGDSLNTPSGGLNGTGKSVSGGDKPANNLNASSDFLVDEDL